MKKIYALLVLMASISAMATNYYTIDLNGSIVWSTDQVTDCGCNPDYDDKHDSIFVNHSYTFTNDIDAKAYFEINTNGGTVIFDKKFQKHESPALIANTNVICHDEIHLHTKKANVEFSNCDLQADKKFEIIECTVLAYNMSHFNLDEICEIKGKKNDKAGNFFFTGNSTINFNDGIKGDEKGDGKITFGESTANFATATNVEEVRIDINALAVMNVSNGVTVKKSEIVATPTSSIIILNNVSFNETDITANTANLVLGENAFFSKVVLDFGDEVNGFFWGSTDFDETEIFLRTGSVMGFLSGIFYEDAELHIEENAIGQFEDANMKKCDLYIQGVLKSDSTTVIIESDMEVSSQGIIDLTDSYYCDFDKSKVNKKKAEDELTCGDSWNPDQNDFKIFENGAWSGDGNAPNNVGVYAEIRDNYETNRDGNILCGSLTILGDNTVTIDSLGAIHASLTFNNAGHVIIKNKGSLVMDPLTDYVENNGYVTLEIKGALSNMKYNVWSTPVRDSVGILSEFPFTNPCDIYAFEDKSQLWKYDYEDSTELLCGTFPDTNTAIITSNDIIAGADGIMDIGRGYFVPGNGLFQARFFSGKVNNGPLSFHVVTTDIGSNPDWDNDDWSLIGNPYPSGLDLNDFWARNAGFQQALTDGIYFWVETVEPPYDQYGSYLTWNFSGGTYLPQYRTEISLVPPGMGFWVLANDPDGSGSFAYDLEFNNTMRDSYVETSIDSRYVSRRYEYNDDRHQQLWINLTNDSMQYDQILIATHPSATDEIDLLFDAHKNYGGEPLALAMVNGTENFTIQGFAPRIEVDTSEIELNVLVSNTSMHYLTIDSTNHYLGLKRVFLLDKLKGTESEMLLGQPLTLDVDSAGVYSERFFLKITNEYITSIDEISDDINGRAWVTNSTLFYDSFTSDISQLNIYDLRGVQVFSKQPNNRNSSVNLSDLNSGVYLVEFTDVLNRKLTKKVFVE